MISRAQRKQTRTGALRARKNRARRNLSTFLAVLVVALAVCGSATLAAPEIDDSPSPERMAELIAGNGPLAQAARRNEMFVADSKTSAGLCSFAAKACREHWNYVYGGKGQSMTPSLISSIVLSNLNDARSPYLRDGYIASTLGQTGNRATDCSGLVMVYMWWAGDASDPVQALCPSISYYNANAMLEAAVEKGPMSNMPEIPGLLVHSNGHVGIYIGNGEVIEARGVRYGVTKTQLNERSFKYWSKSPWIDYDISGIYEIAGRYAFLDNGVDIGKDRWVAKYVFGNELAGSTYTPVCDPSASFGSSLPAVYDADATAAAGRELTLVDRILASIDILEYDPRYGYLYDGNWYVIQVDANGMPMAYLNNPGNDAANDTSRPEGASESIWDDTGAGDSAGPSNTDAGPITFAPEPVMTAPDPVTWLTDSAESTETETSLPEPDDGAASAAEGSADDEE